MTWIQLYVGSQPFREGGFIRNNLYSFVHEYKKQGNISSINASELPENVSSVLRGQWCYQHIQ